MDSYTTNYLYDIISKCAHQELQQISLQQVKTAYTSLGLKPGSKRKEELINDIISYLASILIKQCSTGQIRDGFPLFNHNNELFLINPHVKNLINSCNHQIHITNLQLAQINFNRLNQVKRIPVPTQNAVRCYCEQPVDQNATNDPQLLRCINPKCGKLVHKLCMKVKSEKESYPLFECPDCVLLKCDPLHLVIRTLVPPFVVDNAKRNFIIEENIYKEIKTNPRLAVEVRCIRLEDKSHEQCWPHAGELFINQFRFLEFKPLQQNSSLKKRKDEKLFTSDVNPGANMLLLKYTKNSDPRNLRAEETYVACVFLVKKLTCEELVQKIRTENRRSIEDCKKQIVDDFETSSIDIDKLVYPLTCVLDLQPLKTPAKGAHCKHTNCFSLENFVNVWQKSNQRKWNCPICKTKSYDIIVDSYFEKVIDEVQKSGLKNLAQVEVQISRNAEYKFQKIEDDTDSEDEQQKVEAKSDKQQDKSSVIVLDDSDDESNAKKSVPKKASDSAMAIETPVTEKKPANNSNAMVEEKPISNLPTDKKYSPIQIASNDPTPTKLRDQIEDPKVQKFAPHMSEKDQLKVLEQKHKESLQNKAAMLPKVDPKVVEQAKQAANQAANQFKPPQKEGYPFATFSDFQKLQSQRQAIQEKLHSQSAMPINQAQPQPQKQEAWRGLEPIFPGLPGFPKFFDPRANPALMQQMLMNPKAPKMPTQAMFQDMMMKNLTNISQNEFALKMRQFEAQNPGMMRPGGFPGLPQPGDLNFMSGMNRGMPPTGMGMPVQSPLIKESLTPKMPVQKTEVDTVVNQSPKPMPVKGMPVVEKKKDFEATGRSIQSLTENAEVRRELPSFENFKMNKPGEAKPLPENAFMNHKDLIASMMHQFPSHQWGKEKAKGPLDNHLNGTLELENKGFGLPKIQGKASDPICLD